MGMISRYFQRLGALVWNKRPVGSVVIADAQGLQIGDARVMWDDLSGLEAFKRDIFSRDFHCLAIVSTSGRVFEINEESPGWVEAGKAIERFLPDSRPHAEWTLQLIAAKPGESVTVFPLNNPALAERISLPASSQSDALTRDSRSRR